MHTLSLPLRSRFGLAVLPLLVIVPACVPANPIAAPPGSQIIVPDDVTIGWSSDYNGLNDGYGAIVIADVMVTDANAIPLQDVRVEVTSGYGGVLLVPDTAIKLVDPPNAPDGGCPSDGVYDTGEEGCAWVQDTLSGQYYEFSGDYYSAGGYAPTYFTSATDGRGLVRFYLYIDALPVSEQGTSSFVDVPIYATIQVDGDSFLISASQ